MRRLLIPVASLLISDALLLIGHGLQLTLLPLRAALEGFDDTQIAFTGSAYFAGFVAGCLLTPLAVRRAGHIRSFAVLASGFSALVLLFEMIPEFWTWLFLRLFTGACISGLYMIIESWLNERATRETRGTILSIYTITNLSMIVVGQQLINLADPAAGTLFSAAAILISLAIIPVSLTSALAPAPLQLVRIDLPAVWRLSRVGLGGAVASGLATGAFWSLGPVYGRGMGLDTPQITGLMSAAVLGGALMQYPIGHLSDRHDRRLVLLGTSIVGALVAMSLGTIPDLHGSALLGLAFAWGATHMTLYAICLAHATDHAPPEQFVMVGSAILMTHGAASGVGGPVASLFMGVLGPGGLFTFGALVMLVLSVGIVRRRRVHELPENEDAEPFRVMDVMTPAALEMDPRTEAHPAPDEDETAPGNNDPEPRAA